jgi:hypothetical protein
MTDAYRIDSIHDGSGFFYSPSASLQLVADKLVLLVLELA